MLLFFIIDDRLNHVVCNLSVFLCLVQKIYKMGIPLSLNIQSWLFFSGGGSKAYISIEKQERDNNNKNTSNGNI